MRRILFYLSALVILLGFVAAPVAAYQTDEISLNVKRSFGFSSGTQIRGTFTLDIVGKISITSVKYLLDGKQIAEVSQSPFSYSFQTTTYPDGWHELSAEVRTTDNRTLQTASRKFEFVSSEVEGQAVSNIIVPLLGLVSLIMIGGVLSQILLSRRSGLNKLPYGAERKFGVMGGTICPKCQRAFSIHWWGMNAVVGKLDRCDFCGKWSIVRRKSPAEIQAAITAELTLGRPESAIQSKSKTEKDKEKIDDSKYIDL